MINPRSPRHLTLLLLFLCSLTACSREKDAADPVLVSINGRTVTVGQFKAEFAKTLSSEQNLTPEEKAELERSFLVQVIDQELALAEAARLKIETTPAEVDAALADYRRDYPDGAFEEMLKERGITLEQWRQELEQSLLIEKLARQVVYPEVTVSDEEIAAYYEENKDDFDRPEQVRARQIVVASQEEGERILGLLRSGEAFEAVARQSSLSPDSENGGDLGFFSRGEMPAEFDQVVFTLPVGQISDLVRSEYGFHIFLVEERREAVRLTLEQVRSEIREELRAEREELAYQQWLVDMRGRSKIEVKWSLL
jgi:peptidyl-prolyl cis-trans isomerase C